MSERLKILLLFAGIQAACLGFGLWMQDQFVVAAARWNQQQQGTGDATATPSSEALLEAMSGVRMLTFLWVCGLQSVVTYLCLTRMLVEHSERESALDEQTLLKTKELVRTRDAIIFGLAKLAESRDPDTGQHLERIALYSTRLATAMRRSPRFRGQVTPAFVRTIGVSSALHDIGKVGIEDSVLLKPGRLDDDERFRMQIHTSLGGECIRQIEKRLGNSNFLQMAREIALWHHEHWDGNGYPSGKAGDDIPLAARIVAVADVYDALRSQRVYKEAYTHDRCVNIIRGAAGKQFDPEIVDVFLAIELQFEEISQRYAEPDEGHFSLAESSDLRVRSQLPDQMTPMEERLLTHTLEKESFSVLP